jgi:hypothetical protein
LKIAEGDWIDHLPAQRGRKFNLGPRIDYEVVVHATTVSNILALDTVHRPLAKTGTNPVSLPDSRPFAVGVQDTGRGSLPQAPTDSDACHPKVTADSAGELKLALFAGLIWQLGTAALEELISWA